MKLDDRGRDSLPGESATVDDVAEFWDTHDTMDYEEAFTDADVTFDIRRRRYEVEVREDTFALLAKRAASLDEPIAKLVDDVLRRAVVGSAG